MSKPFVLISIDTRAKTENIEFGRSFINVLCNEDVRLIPDKLSMTESYRDPFMGIENFLEKWWAVPVKTTVDGQARPDSFHGPGWKSKSTLASRGMVNHGITDIWHKRYPGRVWFECRWSGEVDFNNIFQEWIKLATPEMGMLHVFTDIEREAKGRGRVVV